MSETQPEELTGSILVVDDSIDGSTTLRDILELEGFTVRIANNGPAALEIIYDQPPDLVLLDVMMPGMSGIEVLGAIRAHPPSAETPVIMVTALDEPHDVVRGLDLGANDYLTKPPQYEILVARVRTQLKIKRLQDQRRLDLIRLQELGALKDKFLQIAAHDLKNPINNIMIGIQLLDHDSEQAQAINPRYPEVLQIMTDAANTMKSIVSDFLDLQAMQAGQIALDLRPVLLNAIVHSVIRQFHSYAESKSISIQAELDNSMPETVADPDRLMQVASNLVGNAIKFSPPGATVMVRSRVGNVHLRVEVEDNGPGIPPEDMPMLFQEFSRLHNKPTGGEKSSGLGLSIARRLVELHEGHIGAQSEPGNGSVFWFEIPRREVGA